MAFAIFQILQSDSSQQQIYGCEHQAAPYLIS